MSGLRIYFPTILTIRSLGKFNGETALTTPISLNIPLGILLYSYLVSCLWPHLTKQEAVRSFQAIKQGCRWFGQNAARTRTAGIHQADLGAPRYYEEVSNSSSTTRRAASVLGTFLKYFGLAFIVQVGIVALCIVFISIFPPLELAVLALIVLYGPAIFVVSLAGNFKGEAAMIEPIMIGIPAGMLLYSLIFARVKLYLSSRRHPVGDTGLSE